MEILRSVVCILISTLAESHTRLASMLTSSAQCIPSFFLLPSSCNLCGTTDIPLMIPLIETHQATLTPPGKAAVRNRNPVLHTLCFSHLLPDPGSLPSQPRILHPSLPLFLLSPPSVMTRFPPPPPRHGFTNHQTMKAVERGLRVAREEMPMKLD